MASADLTVGEVLSLLQGDFPEATMGWIRSLEQEHLIVPARTPKGNRLFSPEVVETLRWILSEQRAGTSTPELRAGLAKAASAQRDRTAAENAPRLFDDPTDILPPINFDEDDEDDEDDDDLLDLDDELSALEDDDLGDDDDPPTSESPMVVTQLRPAQGTTGSHPAARLPRPPDPPAASAPSQAEPDPTPTPPEHETDPADERRMAAAAVNALQEAPSPTPPEPEEERPRPARVRELNDPSSPLLTREEFRTEVGLDEEALGTLELYGIIAPIANGGFYYYDAHAVRVGGIVSGFVRLGLEARHLRMYRLAAEREVALLEQLALPLLKQRNPVGREQAKATLAEAAELSVALHSALVEEGIGDLTR